MTCQPGRQTLGIAAQAAHPNPVRDDCRTRVAYSTACQLSLLLAPTDARFGHAPTS